MSLTCCFCWLKCILLPCGSMCNWRLTAGIMSHIALFRALFVKGGTHPSRGQGMDQGGHLNRKLRFQGFCRFIRLIEQVFWSFYSTVRSDMQYWLAFSWPYNLLSDKVLRITVDSCTNASYGNFYTISTVTTHAPFPISDKLASNP